MREDLKHIILLELNCLVLLFPLWWFLGVEQFFWFVGVGIIFIQFCIYIKWKFRMHFVAFLLFTFLVIYGISFFSIQEKMRYVTYFRNLSTYITALMLLIITWNVVERWEQIERLLEAIVTVMFIASVLGILAFLFEGFRIKFESFMGFFLPESISSTSYGSVIATRNVGFYNWFFGLGTYFRVSSFFLYSTMFSSTLALTFPIALYLRSIKSGFSKRWYAVVVVVMFFALLATTGRVAIMAVFLGYAVFRFLLITSFAIRFSIVSFGLLFLFFLFLWLEQSGFLYEIIELALYSRGEGSASSRLKIYTQTFGSFLERPFFGWGTERDVKGLAYPLGSHSYYLGTLYKQGIVGLLVFLGITLAIWNTIKVRGMRVSLATYKLKSFLQYGQFVVLVYMINSFTDVLDLDATTMMLLWLIFSLLIIAKRMYITNLRVDD